MIQRYIHTMGGSHAHKDGAWVLHSDYLEEMEMARRIVRELLAWLSPFVRVEGLRGKTRGEAIAEAQAFLEDK